MSEYLWVEKYRPKKIEDCILSQDIKETFSQFLSQKEYFLSFQIINLKNEHFKLRKVLSFNVNFVGINGLLWGGMESAYFRPKFNWNFEKKIDAKR